MMTYAQKQANASYLGIATILAVAFLAMASSSVPSPLYPLYQQRFGMSVGATSAVYAVYAAGVLLTLFFSSRVNLNPFRKRTLVFGVLGLLLSCVVFCLASNLTVLLIARLLQGVGIGMITGVAGAALGRLVAPAAGHIAAYSYSAATTLGIALGGVGSGWLAQIADDSVILPFVVLGTACAMVLALVVFGLSSRIDSRGGSHAVTSSKSISDLLGGVRSEFTVGASGLFAAWAVGGVYLALGSTVTADAFGEGRLVLGALCLVLVQGVGGVVQVIVSVRYSDIEPRRLYVVGLVCLLAGVVVAVFSLALGWNVMFFVAAGVSGIGFGLTYMASTSILQTASPADRVGRIMSMYFSVGYVAISIPALLAGILVDVSGTVSVMVGFAVVMIVVSAWCMYGLAQMRRRQASYTN